MLMLKVICKTFHYISQSFVCCGSAVI